MLYNSFMNTNELCNIAQKNNIRIHYESLQKDGAAVYYNNKYEIVLSKSLLSSQIKERESLAEELAHCLTGTVYPISLATTTLGRLIIASAERVARQTGALVISISQRRNIITLYRGEWKYVLKDVGVILAKANQALQTLEKYRVVLLQALNTLTALEFDDATTLLDVAAVIQKAQMVHRIAYEIERYVTELGIEGRLVKMQLEELMVDVENEDLLVIEDYLAIEEKTSEEIWQQLGKWSAEDLLDPGAIAKVLGYSGSMNSLEQIVYPKGYRVLNKIPRLPQNVIDNIVSQFKQSSAIVSASIEELDAIEGIGEVRARAIQEGLRRIKGHVLLDRNI